MIISYRYNYAYVKTHKTAGTSLEIALSSHTGGDDIVTPFGMIEDDILRLDYLHSRLPQNYSADHRMEETYRKFLHTRSLKKCRAYYRSTVRPVQLLRAHASLEELKAHVRPDFLPNAFVFTVERHPYEKAVSMAHFRVGLNSRKTFSEHLEEIVCTGASSDIELYMLEGRIRPDFVARYERLDEDLALIAAKIGYQGQAFRLPLAKSHYRSSAALATDILNASQKKILQQTCDREFEMFPYER